MLRATVEDVRFPRFMAADVASRTGTIIGTGATIATSTMHVAERTIETTAKTMSAIDGAQSALPPGATMPAKGGVLSSTLAVIVTTIGTTEAMMTAAPAIAA